MIRVLFFLSISFIAACGPRDQSVEIVFEVRIDGQPVSCADTDRDVRLTDLRFYVHDLNLVGPDGARMPVRIVPDGVWQSTDVALIDLEDGAGDCLNGSTATNSLVRGTYRGGPVNGLTFELGVPASLNHQDPLLADAPLGYSEMHWHWASGYKFLRAGMQTDTDAYFLHLGSSRCEGTIGNIKGCKSANRPQARLDDFEPGTDRVILDLAALFAAVDLQDGVRTDCQSGPADPECAGPFAALGIDFDSGNPTGPAAAFRTGKTR